MTDVETTRPLTLITGGSRGIGRILATGFAEAGYPVAITATDADRAQAAAAEIAAETSGTVTGFGVDVSQPGSVAALRGDIEAHAEDAGVRLGVLINNAGRVESSEGPLWEADPDSLVGVIGTNVIGPLLMINAFAPVLIATAEATGQPGRIIDLNSGSGAQGTPAYGAYSASKAALFRIADSVVHFGDERGLKIFELAPGVIRSDMTASMPMHGWRTEADWTSPAELAALALAAASGELDGWTGRYIRAGHDTAETLSQQIPAAGSQARKLITEMDIS